MKKNMKGNVVFNLNLNKIEFIHIYTMLIESVRNKLKELKYLGSKEDRALCFIEILDSHNLVKDFEKMYPEIHTLYDLEDEVNKIKKMQDYYFNIAKENGFVYEHLI